MTYDPYESRAERAAADTSQGGNLLTESEECLHPQESLIYDRYRASFKCACGAEFPAPEMLEYLDLDVAF